MSSAADLYDMVESGYSVTHVDDVSILRMAEVDDVPEKFDRISVQNLDDEELGTEEMKVKVWHIPPGEHMGVHGHPSQEEFYYVLEGQFRVHIGPPGETDTYEIGTGSVFAASPEIARGYENIGDDSGRVLVVAAPNVPEHGIPEGELKE